jgi:hypothetical protein
MLVAKRHFVTRRDILAMAITLTEARGADFAAELPGASRPGEGRDPYSVPSRFGVELKALLQQ